GSPSSRPRCARCRSSTAAAAGVIRDRSESECRWAAEFRWGSASGSRWKSRSASRWRSEEHTSELQSLTNLVCRLLLEKKKYDNPNALRDYFRDIGRMVLAAEGRKANDSHADCYQYFCVPEYGTANGLLHFHAVYFMRTLPTGSVDPNFGCRVRNRRQLNSLLFFLHYGASMQIPLFSPPDPFSD